MNPFPSNNCIYDTVIRPIACPVGNNAVISPSAGKYKIFSSGTIAIPSPNAPEENALSFNSDRATTFPFNGIKVDAAVDTGRALSSFFYFTCYFSFELFY
ncbi:hypothetical protein ACTRHJ_002522 [Enterococcus faecalis]|uniref:hypothetical protein n=1 Tax=Enterococcus faecalis TaxID=1351 RepID=UPI001F1C7945|nr:hypothetical protein [Enterococcus faecalis]